MKAEVAGNNVMREHKANGVYTDTASSGVSSNDTHRSSVRYEPVVTDHSCTPPSPGRHGSRHKLLGNGKSSKHRSSRMTDEDITDEDRRDSRDDDVGDDDEIGSMDDVIRSEELRPLNARRRMSSPVIEQHGRDQYGAHRESNSFLARTNSGTVYVTKGVPSTLPIEPRHQTGLPRMGTGLPPAGTSASSQNTASMGTPQLYKSPVPNSLVSSRLATSQTEQFDPVVLTTLKPTHESGPSGWNYVGGPEVRSQYPVFSGGVNSSLPPHRHSGTTPSGEDTAARFMNKRPSLANAYNASRRISNTQFDASTFKCFKSKMSSGCSWKCAALAFIFISVLLLALVAFFLVQSLSANPVESSEVKCLNGDSEGGLGGGTTAAAERPFEIQMGRKKLFTVPPEKFWRSFVYMGEDAHLKFNFTVNRRAVFGVYGRQGIKPTHTKYDFFERIDGSSIPVASTSKSGRRKRDTSSGSKVTLSFVQFMKAGNWHIGVFNDGEEPQEAEIETKLAEGISSCPNKCNGNGDCIDGVCKCFPRYQGRDCSEASCPIVCSGRGLVAHGACVCFSGWKGRDCSVPTDQCEVKDCSGHGTCGSDGECECEPGWTGPGCSIVTCLSATCSDHGVCVKGVCHCDRGYKGQLCEEEDNGCFDKCSGHGNFDDVTGACVCNTGWTGRDCSKASTLSPIAPCLPACHPEHGTCISGSCHCNEGWTGNACDQRMCHSSCYEHGTCSNGHCVCSTGWNGDLCTFDACPNNCGGHGHCSKDADGQWFCQCQPGWKGSRCDIAVETQCTDGRDNDRDTLVDCHDPDCCSQAACQARKECKGSSDPVRVIARLPTHTRRRPRSTFYERVQFLVQPSSSIQTTSHPSTFKAKETSVLRGKVVTLDGSPLVGVTVRIEGKTQYGFTKTRRDGWYDIMVNGGGSLTLHFDRDLLQATTITIYVPLNEFVLVPAAIMRTPSQPEQLSSHATMGEPGHCDVSVFPRPKAIILPINVQAFTADNCDDRGAVIPETQAVRETIGLPFSGVDLVYLSSRASDYKSKIEIQLTPLEVASNLNRVHLRISVQGVQFEKMFAPISELRYTFSWERKDAYEQPVYGSVTAKVEVGYEYELCPSIVWDMHLTTLEGLDPIMPQSVGGWSLNIHHTYHAGVVHLGNGGRMQLNRQPPMMSTVMGTGAQRHPSCDRCTGPAISSKLLAPVSLACDARGNVYIGDYNYIRKINNEGQVSSLLFMRNPPHKYYIATSPTTGGTLYYSDPNGKRIYRIRNMNPRSGGRRVLSSADLSTNMEVIAGTGAACLPLVQGNCGDGSQAHSAKLSGPRGLAVDKNGRVYFVDGTTIRTIETNAIINTFAGSNNMAATRPLPCDGTISLDQLQLDFPTDLAINFFDESLYVLDNNVVVRIDVMNKQASLAAGLPMHCMRKAIKNLDERDSRRVPLVSPVAITVSPRDGSLYIAEADNKFIHRVRRVDTYRLQISTVAGADKSCDCQMSDCDCFQGDGDFARSARLNTPAALAASPNGSVYIADQLNLRIRKISSTLPDPDSNGKIRIANPDSNHVYVFSRDGLHLTTQNVITGMPVYNFTYSSEEKLNSISDVHGNRLSIIPDMNEVPSKILLPNREILQLQFDQGQKSLRGIAQRYQPPLATLTYQGDDSSLLQSITHGRSSSSFYVYDADGRLVSAVSPSGGLTSLHTQVNATTHTVTMSAAATSVWADEANDRGVGARDTVIATKPGYICDVITTKEGDMTATYERWTDNSISVHFLDGSELSLETKPHPVLGLTAPFLAKRTIHVPQDPLENNIEWRARKELETSSSARDKRYLLGRRMRVNGRNILSLDYSQKERMEKIYDDHTKFTLKIYYNDRGMPRIWVPSGGITPVNVTYDRHGHPTTWQRGQNEETVKYDEGGRITSRKTADRAVWTYINQDNDVQLTVPGSSAHYAFVYDDFENVRRITLPSGISYTVARFMGIGFKRIQIENSAADMKFAMDFDDKDNILMQDYEGEGRKVVYRYDTHGHMTEVLHDKQRTHMLRDPRSGELVSMTTDDCMTRFYRNGPLVQKLTVTSEPARYRSRTSAKFEYAHDVNLRLKSLKATINDTSLPTTNIEYDDVSGKVTQFGTYSVYYFRANMYMISTTDVSYKKEHDHSGRPVQVTLEIYRTPFFVLNVEYDVMGRVSKQEYEVGLPANITETRYIYNADGTLSTATIPGKFSWRYEYDSDGKMSSIRRGSDVVRIRYDQSGRVTARGSVQYIFDKDGFLTSRGKEIFEYDSLGHLVAAYRTDGAYKVQYGYDGFGRLSSRFDEKSKQVLRYYYADVGNPARLTHYHNSTSGLLTTLQYDTEGNLFALDHSDGRSWSVMCDNNGSPLAIMDATGTLLKSIGYTPLGDVEWEKNPTLQIAIGYRGGIYDPATGLVHFADRSMIQQSYKFGEKKAPHRAESLAGVDYDPLVSQTTSPDYTMLLHVRESAPQPLKIYQVTDPVNPVPPYNQMTLVSNWLDALGFKLQNVAPDPKIDDRQKDKSSVECQLSHHLQTYINLQTVSFSSLVPENRKNFKQIPNGALFAQGLVLSIDKGSIATHVAHSATNDVKRLSSVLNGGDVIVGKNADSSSAPMSFTVDRKPVIYVSKSLNSLRADKALLSLTDDSKTLDGGYSNVGTDLGSGSAKSNVISVGLSDDVLTAESPYCIVVISYITNDNKNGRAMASEEVRVTENALAQAEKEAWALEAARLRTGRKVRWTVSEKQQLRTLGRVNGYKAVFFWDVNRYPEFADSGRNVDLVKT